jgi:[acyl-carrier-protein] S-malonyltransferase
MGTAAPELEQALAGTDMTEPSVPVYSGVTAAPIDDPRARLVEGLTSPVRWREIVLALRDRGVTRFLEVGPGRVLTGLVRKTLDGVEAEVVSQEAARA